MSDLRSKWGAPVQLRAASTLGLGESTVLGDNNIDWAGLGAFGGTVYLTLAMGASTAGVQVRIYDRLGDAGAYGAAPYAEFTFSQDGVHDIDVFNKAFSAVVIENLDTGQGTGNVALHYRAMLGESVTV